MIYGMKLQEILLGRRVHLVEHMKIILEDNMNY